MADAGTRYKAVATTGYALSAVCKVGLLAVGGAWMPIAGLMMLDRLGKGIRTAPRDALITLSSDWKRLGEAFGMHRALDAIGAMMGPLLAFAVLAAAPGAYDAVFVIGFAVAIIGLAIIWLFVNNQRRADVSAAPAARPGLANVFEHLRFRAVVVAGGLLAVLAASDALIYLLLQRRSAMPPTLLPLLFVGTAAASCCWRFHLVSSLTSSGAIGCFWPATRSSEQSMFCCCPQLLSCRLGLCRCPRRLLCGDRRRSARSRQHRIPRSQ